MIRLRKLLILISLLLILLAATFAAYATDVPLSEHLVDSNFQGAQSIYGADLDGDGDLDLLGAANTIDDIVWWENTGGEGATWEEHTIEGAFDGAIAARAADMDGDGDLDVLGAAMDAADVTWWENTNGDGSSWEAHAIDEAFTGVYGVYATDLDADGDLDVLGAVSGLNDITWWQNTAGDGTTWTEHVIDGSFGFASAVYAADVDSDGDMDVLRAAGGDDLIAWWENDGNTPTSTPTSTPTPTTISTNSATPTPEPTTATMTATNSPTSTVIKATASATATVSKEKKLYLPIIVR